MGYKVNTWTASIPSEPNIFDDTHFCKLGKFITSMTYSLSFLFLSGDTLTIWDHSGGAPSWTKWPRS